MKDEVFENVKVKISSSPVRNSLAMTETGTQVEMHPHDQKFIEHAFLQFEEAQQILQEYLSEETVKE